MVIVLDGVSYDVPVIGLKRAGDFLDKYAHRTVDGNLHRELIGVYFNYKLEIGRVRDQAAYETFWNKLTEPTEFHTIVVPDGDYGTRSFTGYFANVTDELKKVDGQYNLWTKTTVNFISKTPTRS